MKRRFFTSPYLYIILLVAAGYAFLRPLVSSSSPPSAPATIAALYYPTVLQCKIDPAKILRPVPTGLFGTNLEWFNYANGVSRADGTFDPAWPTLLKTQGVTNIRFPGGTLSDFYHWRDGIGPVKDRPVREHPTDPGSSPNVMGTPEFLRFASAANARPLITVNVGTGTPDEAAAWVAYANKPDNAERIADGVPASARVDLWEVGNEVYLAGNPTDKQKITVAPADYADRFLVYADAMRKVDPTIKLMAIGTANSTTVSLPYPDWSDVVLGKAAGAMDYYAVHNAYFPLIFGLSNLSTKTVYQSLWAAPEEVGRSLTQLDQLITRYEQTRRVEIAVTEWGALFSFNKAWVDHVKTQGSAVYLARLMQVFLNQPRVTQAQYFKFTDASFMGWVGYDRKPKVPYYVIQLFTQHFGTRLVPATLASPNFSVGALGAMAAQSGVPEVTAVASLDATGRKLFVNLVNRSWATTHRVRFDTGSFPAATTARTWTLSSPGVTDHNGPDIPPDVPKSLYTEPTVSPYAKLPITLQQKSVDLRQPIYVSPYSIVTVEIDSR